MAKEILDAVLPFGPFSGGLFDAGDAEDTPPEAFREVLGFQWKDGPFPQSEKGRQQYTGPQIVTSVKPAKGIRWIDGAGNKKLITVEDQSLWISDEPDGSTGATVSTLINTIYVGGTAGTTDSDTVTVVGAGAIHGQKTLKTGTDRFWYNSDGRSKAATLNDIIGETGFTIPGYAGAATSGAFTIERHLGATIDLALFDGRVAVSDGVLRWHWYGGTKSGETNYVFREHGLPVPETAPTLTLASGGSLGAGDYQYKYTVLDPRGVESNPITCQTVTATANQKCTLGGIPKAPRWATKAQVYRTIVNGTECYSIFPDIAALRVLSSTSDGTTTDIRLNASAADLIANMHVFRAVKFLATGNEYVCKANSADTITVFGNASAESTTDDVSIVGGVDLYYAQTGNITDVTGDTDLNLDVPAPSDNGQGSTGASQITAFRDDGRLAWVVNKTQVEFSGRSSNASRATGENSSGEGRQLPPEFELCQCHHDVNADDKVEIVRLWAMEGYLYAGRIDGFWGLEMPTYEVSAWQWKKRISQYGLLAKESVAVHNAGTYCLVSDAGEAEVLWFDGFQARGLGRRRLGSTLDGISVFENARGVVFEGVYYLSYTRTGQTVNDRLLGYYIRERIFDMQGWGCGTFIPPYKSGNTMLLYCYAPTAVGHIYRVFATASDLGGVIVRRLVTGKRSLGPVAPRWEPQLVHVSAKGP